MADDPHRGLRPFQIPADAADAEETELFYETPSIPETTEERSDTTEVTRPSSTTTEILPRGYERPAAADLPPRIPQLPPESRRPKQPPGPPRAGPNRMVPLVGVLLATATGLTLIALLVLLVAFGV